MKVWAIGLFLCAVSGRTNAQSFSDQLAAEVSFMPSRLLKHTSKLTFDAPSVSFSEMINIKYQTDGSVWWHKGQRYPEFGLAFVYTQTGNPSELGYAVAIMPNIRLRLLQKNRWGIHTTVGTGIAYLDKHYDPDDNPENNAIGSHVNNITHLGIDFRYSPCPSWIIGLGGGLTHYSNGGSSYPNFGLNFGSASVSGQYNFGQRVTNRPVTDSSSYSSRKWRLGIGGGIAKKQQTIAGGPFFPFYNLHAHIIYKLYPSFRIQAGSAYELDKKLYYWGLHNNNFADENYARKASERWSVYGAGEILFGHLSLVLQMGAYVSDKSEYLPNKIYERLSVVYYLPLLKPDLPQLGLGVHLKVHRFTAEYIMAGIEIVL